MTTTIIAVVVVLLLIAALRLWLTANRLDRLHVRTEAAWAALEGALSRRVVAARAVAAAGGLPPERAALLRGIARQADDADRARRAAAENELSHALAELPPTVPADLHGELDDAQERMTLAKRFYNDAVRDTRALREAWFTRLFRLAGSAAMPEYFQVTEYPTVDLRKTSVAGNRQPDGSSPLSTGPVSGPGVDPQTIDPISGVRRSGRVVVLDEAGRVLLFHGTDPGRPGESGFWVTPGGGTEPGEDELACAVRELREETGIVVEPAELGGPIWIRKVQFEFMGELLFSEETFFTLRLPGGQVDIDISGFTELECNTVDGHRWWSAAELVESGEIVYPVELPARLGEVADMLPTMVRTSTPAAID
ncbi:NUDIX hydrolase [Nakamurella lactea]|uniref:NUDIX hydrolase n=1 Tax=Nakamurella lactea TaxID=459515 RepID=UPI00048BC8D0|nr:NUDIX domain-containing protein [Nakamurella lactea]